MRKVLNLLLVILLVSKLKVVVKVVVCVALWLFKLAFWPLLVPNSQIRKFVRKLIFLLKSMIFSPLLLSLQSIGFLCLLDPSFSYNLRFQILTFILIIIFLQFWSDSRIFRCLWKWEPTWIIRDMPLGVVNWVFGPWILTTLGVIGVVKAAVRRVDKVVVYWPSVKWVLRPN